MGSEIQNPKSNTQDFRRRGKAAARLVVLIVVLMALCCATPEASASLLGGIRDILAAVVEIPRSTLVGAVSGPPGLGAVLGAITGAFSSVALLTRGTLQLIGPAVGIAKRAAPFVLPFLL